MLVGDEKRIQRENITLIDNEESVAFRILVRRRNDGSLITFQESSVYVPMPLNHIPLGLKSSSSSTGVSSGKKKEKFVKLESKVEAVEEVGKSLYCCYHVVDLLSISLYCLRLYIIDFFYATFIILFIVNYLLTY